LHLQVSVIKVTDYIASCTTYRQVVGWSVIRYSMQLSYLIAFTLAIGYK
jgi:hypothetical protein